MWDTHDFLVSNSVGFDTGQLEYRVQPLLSDSGGGPWTWWGSEWCLCASLWGLGRWMDPPSWRPRGSWSITRKPGSPRALPLQKGRPCPQRLPPAPFARQTQDLQELICLLVLTELIQWMTGLNGPPVPQTGRLPAHWVLWKWWLTF